MTRPLALVAALALSTPALASAQGEWLLALEADVAVPTVSPTVDRFGPGAAVSAGAFVAAQEWLLMGARLRAGFLSDGPAPADPTLADPGVGDLLGLAASLRLRPLTPLMPGPERGTGLFVELGGGGVLTGGLVRPAAEAAIGWGFAIDDVDLAPVARWLTVFEVDNQLDDRPAHVLLVGVELSLFDARPAPPEEPPPPPGDRDGDGYTDDVDGCTEEPEDFDGFEDEDGCPEADNDRDGILDGDDACPLEREDVDGFEDEDGCPDADNDGDGFRDWEDACPDEPEVVNGVDDRDGCPDEGLIEMVDDRIVLEERVLFDFARTRVRRRAWPIIAAIAELVAQHPEWTALRVEGHADVRGTREGNQRLSEGRARRVRLALIQAGVSADIIEAAGYGETRPRQRGDTEAIHQMNRRVEFVVVRRRDLTPSEEAAAQAAAAEERAAALARRVEAEAAAQDAGEAVEALETAAGSTSSEATAEPAVAVEDIEASTPPEEGEAP